MSPTCSSSTRSGVDAELRGEAALEADRDVAQPDRPVALVEQGLGDDPDRVGEVDDPGAGRGPSRRPARRGRGRRARSAAPWRSRRRPVVSWPIMPNSWGSVSSHEPRRLAADAELDQHEVRAVDRRVAVARHGRARPLQSCRASIRPASPPTISSRSRSMSSRTSSSTASAVGPPREAVDQLGRVGAAAADDRDLQAHPLLPLRCKRRLDETA